MQYCNPWKLDQSAKHLGVHLTIHHPSPKPRHSDMFAAHLKMERVAIASNTQLQSQCRLTKVVAADHRESWTCSTYHRGLGLLVVQIYLRNTTMTQFLMIQMENPLRSAWIWITEWSEWSAECFLHLDPRWHLPASHLPTHMSRKTSKDQAAMGMMRLLTPRHPTHHKRLKDAEGRQNSSRSKHQAQ